MKYHKGEITFFKKDDVGIHRYNDDPMVIIMRYDGWKIKRVFIVLYLEKA